MENTKKDKHDGRFRIPRIVIAIVSAIIVFALIGFGIYVSGYYRASNEALMLLQNPPEGVKVVQTDAYIAFEPEGDVDAAMVFYPGGLVEAESYTPLLAEFASRGVLCVNCKMPFNLAVFGSGNAKTAMSAYPWVGEWYLGGHSLGGVMASSYAVSHGENIEGLVFLASYPAKDLNDTDFRTITVSATHDEVCDEVEIYKSVDLLPEDSTFFAIEGGCHAFFGDYGAQSGDGTPTISREEQIEQTVDAVYAWMMAA